MFKPIHTLWWTLIGVPIDWTLTTIYNFLAGFPIPALIGAYGLAIIILTILIKLLLSPLFQIQLRISKRNLDNQRRIAPELAELKKKYKNDPQKQQAAMMALYKEHGINPLGGLSGCLPSLVQLPILTALYYVFYGNAKAGTFSAHFLFIPNLNLTPISQPMIHGLPIPAVAYLVIPLLAGATTFVQSRMMQQPPNPGASDQEQQAQNVTRQMQVFMPLMIVYFAVITPAGLGLYWLISNCFAIGQQYLVNGWGGLRPPPPVPAAGPAPKPKPPPPKGLPGDTGKGGPRPVRPTMTSATDPKKAVRKPKR